jgi:hypothetical protein
MSSKDGAGDLEMSAGIDFVDSPMGLSSLRTSTAMSESRRDEIMQRSNPNATLINQLFNRDPKDIGTRRYLAFICLGVFFSLICGLLIGSYYSVSIQPVIELAEKNIYSERTCEVFDNNLFHDVTLGISSSWRGELRVVYNKTIGKSTPFRATVHDMVTGQLGTKAWAVAFIRAHPIGERFKCLVDISNLPWYAALPDQHVEETVTVAVTFLSILLAGVSLVTLRSCYNFYKFKRYYSWNADLGVWSISKQFGDIRHAQLPP